MHLAFLAASWDVVQWFTSCGSGALATTVFELFLAGFTRVSSSDLSSNHMRTQSTVLVALLACVRRCLAFITFILAYNALPLPTSILCPCLQHSTPLHSTLPRYINYSTCAVAKPVGCWPRMRSIQSLDATKLYLQPESHQLSSNHRQTVPAPIEDAYSYPDPLQTPHSE